jgi:hypothetical protein
VGRTYHGSKFNLGVPDGALGNMGQMEARFGPFGDCVNLDARLVHDLRQTNHRLINQFGHT